MNLLVQKTAVKNNLFGPDHVSGLEMAMRGIAYKGHQVFRTVVAFNFIDVVNRFLPKQISPDHFFNDKTMLKDIPSLSTKWVLGAHDEGIFPVPPNPAFPLAAILSPHIFLGFLGSFLAKVGRRYFLFCFFGCYVAPASIADALAPLFGDYPSLEGLAKVFSVLSRSRFFLKTTEGLAKMLSMFRGKYFSGMGFPHAHYGLYGMTIAFSHDRSITHLR